ncbi:MAG: BatD family protein, partial [Chitinispirillaceae bacterium]|nr:BatD family protein [Chitinispirillaceae bacterium]
MDKRLLIVLVFSFSFSYGEVLSFKATTERTKIAIGEQVSIVARLITNKKIPNIGIPKVETNNYFNILKSHSEQSTSSTFEFINGKATQRTEITTTFYYIITPTKTGSFVFPSLTVTIDGTESVSY